MKQLEVQIMGQNYLLGCPDGGDTRLLEAVERVDTAMCKIREGGKVRSRDRIAVLAALNLAFNLTDQSTPQPLPAVAAGATLPDKRSEQLGALLARLDDALNRDDRLL